MPPLSAHCFAWLVAGALLLLSCSNAAVSKAVGAGGDARAPIVLTTSETEVVVENHAGRPLLDVRLTIDVADNTRPFVHVVPTIDVGGKSEVPLTQFRTDEDDLLDPTAIHPRQVTLTARDTVAKSYEITVPWK